MKEDHQLEAKIAFGIAAVALVFALLVGRAGQPPLWSIWWEDVGRSLARPAPPRLMVDLFFLGAMVLWLVSPFLAQVFSRSGVVRMLVLVISVVTATAAGLLFYIVPVKAPAVCALWLAGVAHLAGMFMVRREEPGSNPLL